MLTCLSPVDIIAKYPDSDYEALPHDAEHGRVTYVIVQPSSGAGAGGQQRAAPKNNTARSAGYGTTAPMAPPVHQDPNGTWNINGAGAGVEGSSGSGNAGSVPPTYAEAVGGDHKVQSSD